MRGPKVALFRWMESRFVRNVGLLAGGTAAAQIVVLLALPLLTRLYSPSDFNLLAAYASTLGLLSVAACFRFNLAVPLPRSDATALHLLVLALCSGALVSMLIGSLIALKPAAVARLVGQPALQPYLWLLPAGVFLAAAYDALQYWASRAQEFGLIARTRMTRALGGTAAQAGIGSLLPGPFGLLFGHMLLSGLGFLGLAASFLKREQPICSKIHLSGLRKAAKRYRRFPLYSVPEALFNTAGLEVPILIIAAYAAGPDGGYLMLAMRLLGVPMILVGSSVAQVYLTEAPAKMRNGELAAFTRQMMWTMAKLGAPVMALAGLVSPLVFPYVFGAEWGPSGVMVSWLAPMFLLQFIASPLLSILHVTGRLALAMWTQVAGAVLRVAGVMLALSFCEAWLVEAFAIVGALFYAATILLVWWVINKLD